MQNNGKIGCPPSPFGGWEQAVEGDESPFVIGCTTIDEYKDEGPVDGNVCEGGISVFNIGCIVEGLDDIVDKVTVAAISSLGCIVIDCINGSNGAGATPGVAIAGCDSSTAADSDTNGMIDGTLAFNVDIAINICDGLDGISMDNSIIDAIVH